MAFLLSLVLTAAFVSPVFVLAGWLREPARIRIHSRFNRMTAPRRR